MLTILRQTSQEKISFFFNDTATTEIYTLSLHDALPICEPVQEKAQGQRQRGPQRSTAEHGRQAGVLLLLWAGAMLLRQAHGLCLAPGAARSEEHTSELQSPCNLVCRLLLEKKKKTVRFNLANSRPP